MNTQQAATHVVQILGGKTQHRKAARQRAEQQRQADHTRPRWWVHAHINTRATDKPGTLASLVQSNHGSPAQARDWAEYLTESRTAYTASRRRIEQLTPAEHEILVCSLAGFSHLRPVNTAMTAAELVAQIRLHYDTGNCRTMQGVKILESLGRSPLPVRRHFSFYN